MVDRLPALSEYEFSGCAVRRWNILALYGQQWPNNDPLEQRRTGVFFYYPDEDPDEQWAYREVGFATGIHGCAAMQPEERWIFLLDDGEVYVVGGGVDDYEAAVTNNQKMFFSNVKQIAGGFAFAVGPHRKVFRRDAPDSWVRLDQGLYPSGGQADLEHAGFNDIDGFSPSDLYACGGRGDLWHYNTAVWEPVDVPTNAVLENICCARDGQVYVTTNRRQILKGRGSHWEIIEQSATEQVFESIVDFNGRILISTEATIYELVAGDFRPADLGHVPLQRSRAHMAVGDGILLVAGKDEAASFDGTSWSVIITPGP
jgi:hypothetical protein